MINLANSQLRVDLLDPTASREQSLPRFCPGGFIWQVHDVTAGPLLTGPEWPDPAPSAFNGQGLPEAFRHKTRSGHPLTWRGSQGAAVGIGELGLSPNGEIVLAHSCRWEVIPLHERALFKTQHEAAGHRYELLRLVELRDRTVLSVSSLTNLGNEPLVLEWFAHPFFALTDGLIQAELPSETSLAANPAFSLNEGRLIQLRRFKDEKDGHFDHLHLPNARNLETRLSHPRLSHIDFSTNFAPDECVIWGNSNTFSIEPYLSLNLAPGEMRQWQLRYDFGTSSGISSPGFNARTSDER